jgi:hypothetical protein
MASSGKVVVSEFDDEVWWALFSSAYYYFASRDFPVDGSERVVCPVVDRRSNLYPPEVVAHPFLI